MATKLQVIPAHLKVVNLPDGSVALHKKTRRRRRFKTSVATRKRIAASARKMKIPILTTVAIGIPITSAIRSAGGIGKVIGSMDGFRTFGQSMIRAYTGITLANSGRFLEFEIRDAMAGLGTLAILTGVKRLGLFKGVNTSLAKARLPVRLS